MVLKAFYLFGSNSLTRVELVLHVLLIYGIKLNKGVGTDADPKMFEKSHCSYDFMNRVTGKEKHCQKNHFITYKKVTHSHTFRTITGYKVYTQLWGKEKKNLEFNKKKRKLVKVIIIIIITVY